MNLGPRARRPGGFTLVELLAVVLIVLLVSAVTLPTVVPALSNRQVGEAARILQAGLAGARDAAIRNNGIRGIRLLPDPIFNGQFGAPLASNRFIPIEPASDYTSGIATFPNNNNSMGLGSWTPPNWVNAGGTSVPPPVFPFPFPTDTTYKNSVYSSASNYRGNFPYPLPPGSGTPQVLMVIESVYQNNLPPAPNEPTSWFWNVRIGDRFRFNDSGRYYTVVGPMTVPNPEYFVNDGLPGVRSSYQESYYDGSAYQTVYPQFLFLVNGVDDNNDGYVDNGVNGINDNQNFYDASIPDLTTTSGIPAPDDLGEWLLTSTNPSAEIEAWVGAQAKQAASTIQVYPLGLTTPVLVKPSFQYVITRRPVPSPNAQEVTLPGGAVVDLTTWNSSRERSRLPVDPNNYYVDVMINQAGQVVATTTFSNPGSATMDTSFLHFWIADRGDVYPPDATNPALPIPVPNSGATTYTKTSNNTVLRKDRQLVTLYAKTGQVVTGSIENFDFLHAFGLNGGGYDQNMPFDDAQFGIKETK